MHHPNTPSTRKIIHIDMDCFYAAVEIRDQPALSNLPVAVGGSSQQRGVLTTCNYLARQYGLHSAMPTYQAITLCPDLVLLPVNMAKYKAVSQDIQLIFRQYTHLIEPLSLDEAYLDVSHCTAHQGSATRIAQAIRTQIEHTHHLTASAGIAPNKLLAKIASDWHKPNGQYVITPDEIDAFMHPLPVGKLFGVGKATTEKLHQLDIHTCGDLQTLAHPTLTQHFGRFGNTLYAYARGIDHRAVEPNRIRKSVSIEATYANNLNTAEQCLAKLPALFERLQQRLAAHTDRHIVKQYIKLKFDDFSQTSVERVVTQLDYLIFVYLITEGFGRQAKSVRLLGIGVRFSSEGNDNLQMNL